MLDNLKGDDVYVKKSKEIIDIPKDYITKK